MGPIRLAGGFCGRSMNTDSPRLGATVCAHAGALLPNSLFISLKRFILLHIVTEQESDVKFFQTLL